MTYPCHWFSEQVGLAGDLGSTNDVLIPLTREGYGSGIARPKIMEKDHFEIKGQFLKELHDNTFGGSDNEDANEHIEKVLEIEVISFYKRLDVPTRQILDSKGALPYVKSTDAKKAIQDMADHSQKWHNGTSTSCRSTETSDGLAYVQAQLNNLGREIKKKKKKHLKRHNTLSSVYHSNKEDNIKQQLQDSTKGTMETLPLADLGASVSVMPFSTYTNLGLGELTPTKLIVELADRTVKRPKGIAENVLVGIDKFVFPVDFILLDMQKDMKTPFILGRPFLSTAHAKFDVFKRKITLRVGNDKVVFKSEKPTSNIIKSVYVLSLRERMELDLEARLMGEALILNRETILN
ncbi:putative reverse transcriptase domain-containing protein [Tanacetum coccineum]